VLGALFSRRGGLDFQALRTTKKSAIKVRDEMLEESRKLTFGVLGGVLMSEAM
jgi:hypothetical protein